MSDRVHRQMDLSPVAAALNALLARRPFAVAQELNSSAGNQQAQGAIGAAILDLDGHSILPPAQCRVIWHGSVQVSHLQQAGDHPCRLPKRQLEKNFDGQRELDRGIPRTPQRDLGCRQAARALSSQISRDPRLLSDAV
jgi:hypothetical protein